MHTAFFLFFLELWQIIGVADPAHHCFLFLLSLFQVLALDLKKKKMIKDIPTVPKALSLVLVIGMGPLGLYFCLKPEPKFTGSCFKVWAFSYSYKRQIWVVWFYKMKPRVWSEDPLYTFFQPKLRDRTKKAFSSPLQSRVRSLCAYWQLHLFFNME